VILAGCGVPLALLLSCRQAWPQAQQTIQPSQTQQDSPTREAAQTSAVQQKDLTSTSIEDLMNIKVTSASKYNLVNQRLAVRLLEKRGHRVVVAATGLEALKALEKESFDLVLMDVQMPEMDGLEATAIIREKEKGTGRRQPIVALTAHAMKGDREKCTEGGMDGYLSKPIRPQELDQLLEIYMARRVEARSVTEHVMPTT
jgi:CheY-like chemotaxis protein